MSSIANIPLAGQGPPAPVSITPAQQVLQQAQNYAAGKQEMSVRDQQIQALETENKIRQQQLIDQQEMGKIFGDMSKASAPQPKTPTPSTQGETAAAAGPVAPSAAAPSTPAAPPVGATSAAATNQDDDGYAPATSAAANPAPPAPRAPGASIASRTEVSPRPATPSTPVDTMGNFMDAILNNPKISYGAKVAAIQHNLDMHKRMADNKELDAKILTGQNDRYVGLIDAALQAGGTPDQQEAVYQSIRQQAINEKLPGAEALPAHNPGRDELVQQRMRHMLGSQMGKDYEDMPKRQSEAISTFAQSIDTIKTAADPQSEYQRRVQSAPWYIRHMLPQTYSPDAIAAVKKIALSPKEQVALPEVEAKNEQAVRAGIAARFKGITNPADYTREFDKLDPKYQKELDDPKDFDKTKSAKRAERFGLTPNEARQADYQETEAASRTRRDQIGEERLRQGDRRLDQIDRRLDNIGQPKPATPAQFAVVANRKDTALRQSKLKLDKDLSVASVGNDKAAQDDAYRAHYERMKDAQSAYEEQVSALTGEDQEHNPWADNLADNFEEGVKGRGAAPAVAGSPAPKTTTPPATTPPPAAKPAAATTPTKTTPTKTTQATEGAGKPVSIRFQDGVRVFPNQKAYEAFEAERAKGARIGVTLPGGKVKYFPNQKALDDFSAETGLTFSKQ